MGSSLPINIRRATRLCCSRINAYWNNTIASRVGGVPEVVEGTAAEGFLFKPGMLRNSLAR